MVLKNKLDKRINKREYPTEKLELNWSSADQKGWRNEVIKRKDWAIIAQTMSPLTNNAKTAPITGDDIL
jgi:hypothetical protein